MASIARDTAVCKGSLEEVSSPSILLASAFWFVQMPPPLAVGNLRAEVDQIGQTRHHADDLSPIEFSFHLSSRCLIR